MNTNNKNFQLNALAVAVAGLLAGMSAYAEDPDAATLKRPSSFVEIGVSNTAQSAQRFGEYNGLNKSGGNLIGNFSVRDGDAYRAHEEGGTTRWSLTGSDLGLSTRSLSASYADQGSWSIGLGYDELTHNLSDTYQTPYLGAMGGNRFVLPTGFGTSANTTTLTPAQQAALHTVDVGTTRRNTSLNSVVSLSPRTTLTVDLNHLDQSGAKLTAFGAFGVAAATAGKVTGSVVSLLPGPTDYKTDTLTVALNWMGENSHFTSSYFGSFFRNGYDRVFFDTYAGANATETVSTAPDNSFHQLNFSGGYTLRPTTKLSGNFSYSRNTQNASFVTPDAGMMVAPAPVSSLNGLVVNTHADLKLTDQTTRDLTLATGLKYDLRDNRTDSNFYNFNSIRTSPANYPNTPLSTKKARLDLAGDYRLGRGRFVRMELAHEDVTRWCNNYAVSAQYPLGTNCVVAESSQEDRLDASYRAKASDTVDFKLGYGYGKRMTDSDPTAIAAFNSIKAGGKKGLNAGDFVGFSPYFAASRTQKAIKASGNWQPDERLSLSMGGRLTDDAYDSQYGVKNGNTWSLNLDASYGYSMNGSVSSYVTRQHRQRDMTNLQITTPAVAATTTGLNVPVNGSWSNSLSDDDLTFGLSIKHGGLLGGKLEIAGDLTYSLGETLYGTQLNYAGATLATAGVTSTCSSLTILSCGDLPTIRNEMVQFKLTGTYQVEKSAKVMLGYVFQRLAASDYYYNGYQYGYSPSTLMPSNQKAGEYSNNLVSISYIRNF